MPITKDSLRQRFNDGERISRLSDMGLEVSKFTILVNGGTQVISPLAIMSDLDIPKELKNEIWHTGDYRKGRITNTFLLRTSTQKAAQYVLTHAPLEWVVHPLRLHSITITRRELQIANALPFLREFYDEQQPTLHRTTQGKVVGYYASKTGDNISGLFIDTLGVWVNVQAPPKKKLKKKTQPPTQVAAVNQTSNSSSNAQQRTQQPQLPRQSQPQKQQQQDHQLQKPQQPQKQQQQLPTTPGADEEDIPLLASHRLTTEQKAAHNPFAPMARIEDHDERYRSFHNKQQQPSKV